MSIHDPYLSARLTQQRNCLTVFLSENAINVTKLTKSEMVVVFIYAWGFGIKLAMLCCWLFSSDPQMDMHELDVPVNAVATALKQFFSDLSEPVIPNQFYDEIKEAYSMYTTLPSHIYIPITHTIHDYNVIT